MNTKIAAISNFLAEAALEGSKEEHQGFFLARIREMARAIKRHLAGRLGETNDEGPMKIELAIVVGGISSEHQRSLDLSRACVSPVPAPAARRCTG